MNSKLMGRRLRHLEVRLISAPTEVRYAEVHQRTLGLMSDSDLELLHEAFTLRDAGRAAEYTSGQAAALIRLQEAYDRAVAESGAGFTVHG